MATLILRDTYRALEEEMKEIDRKKITQNAKKLGVKNIIIENLKEIEYAETLNITDVMDIPPSREEILEEKEKFMEKFTETFHPNNWHNLPDNIKPSIKFLCGRISK